MCPHFPAAHSCDKFTAFLRDGLYSGIKSNPRGTLMNKNASRRDIVMEFIPNREQKHRE